jgi:hypothetical protein
MKALKPKKNEKANLAEVRKEWPPEPSKAAPVPVERPRQKKPYVKPTAKELRERYDLVAQLLAHKTKGQIHDYCREQWGVCWRTAETYAARAREAIMAAMDTTKQELRAQSYRFYMGLTLDPAATILDKIRARERIDKLLGLEESSKFEASGPGGKELPTAPQVLLYLPDNGRYDPNPGVGRVPDPNAPAPGLNAK